MIYQCNGFDVFFRRLDDLVGNQLAGCVLAKHCQDVLDREWTTNLACIIVITGVLILASFVSGDLCTCKSCFRLKCFCYHLLDW